mgnify:CR=1 FL=1
MDLCILLVYLSMPLVLRLYNVSPEAEGYARQIVWLHGFMGMFGTFEFQKTCAGWRKYFFDSLTGRELPSGFLPRYSAMVSHLCPRKRGRKKAMRRSQSANMAGFFFPTKDSRYFFGGIPTCLENWRLK